MNFFIPVQSPDPVGQKFETKVKYMHFRQEVLIMSLCVCLNGTKFAFHLRYNKITQSKRTHNRNFSEWKQFLWFWSREKLSELASFVTEGQSVIIIINLFQKQATRPAVDEIL